MEEQAYIENIIKLQKEHNLTQEKMAEIIGISNQSTISNKLSNARFTLKELCKMADYFNVTLDYLLGRDNNSFQISESSLAGLLMSMAKSELIEIYTDKTEKGYKCDEPFPDLAVYQDISIPTIHIKNRYLDKFLFDLKKLKDGFSLTDDQNIFDSWYSGIKEKASKEVMQDSWQLPAEYADKEIVVDLKTYLQNKALNQIMNPGFEYDSETVFDSKADIEGE